MAVALGVALGLALETKGTLLLAVPFLLPFIRHRRYVFLGLALVLTPWIARNAVTLHVFIPFSTGSGHVLYGANNPYHPPGSWQWAITFPDWPQFAGLDEVAQDRALTRAALTFLRTQTPGELIERARQKLITLSGGWGVLAPLLACGFAVQRLRRKFVGSRTLALCCAFQIGLALNTMIFWGDARFLFPFASTAAIGAALFLRSKSP